MNRFSLVVWLCFSAIGSAQTIPIDSVWSNGIKGTKDIGSLEPPNTNTLGGRQAKDRILRGLYSKVAIERNADQSPAIVVAGEPTEALEKALRVARELPPVEVTFTTADNLNFIFFTKHSSTYLELDSIEIKNNALHINYHHITHATHDSNAYIGLIPLGKLPAGEYRVNFHRNYTVNQKGERVSDILAAERKMCRGVVIKINRE